MELDYYAILGVDTDADAATIRDSYKKLALVYHPDKVAEAERYDAELQFKNICEAYETLGNEENRMLYDAGTQYGGFDWHDYYQQQDDSYSSHSRHYSFNTSTTFTAYQPEIKTNRTPNTEINIGVSLEEVYKGKRLQLKTIRQVMCRKCCGTGARSGARKRKCQECRGRGEYKQRIQISPGVFRREMLPCECCDGSGMMYLKTSLCRRCSGTKLQDLESLVDICVPKGVKNNHRIIVEGHSDEQIDKMTGDLVITVSVKSHEIFTRGGNDLYAESKISLKDALIGFTKILINHLDGHPVKIEVPRGCILKPGSVVKVPNEGLPLEQSFGKVNGDLYILLHIEFPEKLSPIALKEIASALEPVKAKSALSSKEKSNDETCPPLKFEILSEQDLPNVNEYDNNETDPIDYSFDEFR